MTELLLSSINDMQMFMVYIKLLKTLSIVLMVITLFQVIFFTICNMKMFEKAGKEWWIALIPIYNSYTKMQIIFGDDYGNLFLVNLVNLIPIVGFILLNIWYFYCNYILYTNFRIPNTWKYVGLFFPVIVYGIIAFDSTATYQGTTPCKVNNYNVV